MPDLAIALSFWKALTGREDHPARLRLIHDRDRSTNAEEYSGPLEALWPHVLAAQEKGFGVFYFLNETDPSVAFASDDNVTAIRVLATDHDDHAPEAWDFLTTPTFIVRTSEGRGQAIWKLHDTLHVSQFKNAQQRLRFHYKSDRATVNPSRIFRLPGTLHQKGEPRLVTFEETGEAVTVAQALAGIPELPKPKAVSDASGEPVDFVQLRTLLAHIDPDVEYPEWIKIVAGIRATNMENDDDEQRRFNLADEWSRGDLTGKPALRYDGDEAVSHVWDSMPPREGGASFGTVFAAARDGGYTGLATPNERGSEVFKDFKLPEETETPKTKFPECITFGELNSTDPGPVQELIPGLLEKGIVTFLSAPGGNHKSRLAIQWGVSLEVGLSIFGRTVETASFVYLSYEDHRDEVNRRSLAIQKRFDTWAPAARYFDMSMMPFPLLVVTEAEVTETEWYHEFLGRLKKIPGHKFVVLDGTYNAAQFVGMAKMNESSVVGAISALQRLCVLGNCTILSLWHPSKSGQEAGDASGWSVAWHNAPRARLSLTKVKDVPDAFDLKVEKRSNGPLPKKPMTLRWSDGAVLPITEMEADDDNRRWTNAVLDTTVAMAEQGTPLRRMGKPETVVYDMIESGCGRRPTDREIKAELQKLQRTGKLRYLSQNRHNPTGYYPPLTGLDSDVTGDE